MILTSSHVDGIGSDEVSFRSWCVVMEIWIWMTSLDALD